MTTAGSMSGLRRLATPRTEPPPDANPPAPEPEKCEMCAVPLGDRHGHVADLEGHRLMCTCRPCYLLFAPEGAAQGRYRAVPERRLVVRDLQLDRAGWETLQVPVDLVFFYLQSEDGKHVAFYPGPGGATESLLALDGWARVLEQNPALGSVLPDVEAVLLRREGDGFECFVVPIDACYELVGLVRRSWTGFAGGERVWRDIDEFFDRLRARSRDVPSGG